MPRKKCHLCGEMTARPVAIWYQAAVAPGVNAPGSKPRYVDVCKSCADLLDDEDDEEEQWNDDYDHGELDDE